MGTTFTATYSPDDNKLRLYASARLDTELYARVKGAGFSWAPKQELFVASAWSPAREDLLIELAGEIDDEDKSLAERAEERADRFDGYQHNRVRDAESAERSVRPLLDSIPLGQPILVGHHSEKRARKDAERIEGAMRKAVTMWDRADYWTSRAAGALSHAKYKELPAVRARRIKGIEADKRKQEKTELEARMRIGEWEIVESMAAALKVANHDHVSVCFTLERYPRDHHTYEGYSSLWSGLEDGIIDHEKAKEIALRVHARTIERAERWIAHYENRLAYERAMLAEGGGLAADRFDLQPGGMVLVRNQWVTILRVNRVGGQATSVRTNARYCSKVNYEEIKDYRPPTEERAEAVKEVTKLAPIVNFRTEDSVEMTKAQWAKQYEKRLRNVQATEENGAYRRRMTLAPGCRLAPVFITDEKVKEAPTPKGVKAFYTLPREKAMPLASKPLTPAPKRGEEVREALKAGVTVAVAPQLFPTPPAIASLMVDLAELEDAHTILEPSAGTGNILRAIREVTTQADVTAVEIDARLASAIKPDQAQWVHHGDFLQTPLCVTGERFDRILMNPPFANADDIRHIRHAMTFLKPGGRLVAICAGGPRQERDLRPLTSHWERLPEGTFKVSGTNVSTVILVIDAGEGS